MTERTFMLTVDLLDPTLDPDALKEFIKTSPLFDNWWNHIPGVFLVVSSKDAVGLAQRSGNTPMKLVFSWWK